MTIQTLHNRPKVALVSWANCLSFLFFFFGNGMVQAQCDINCYTTSNITLNSQCSATVTPANALLNYDFSCTDELTVEVFDLSGVLIPTSPTITGFYIGQALQIKVTNLTTGQSCINLAFIEDKQAPEIFCNKDTINCTEDIPTATVTATDNCGIPALTYTENVTGLDCNATDFLQKITRIYTATDGTGMTATCVQETWVRKPTADDLTFPPDYDGFDQPVLDCGTTNSVDPEITGYPQVYGTDIVDACMLDAFFNDDTTTMCEGKTVFYRDWFVANWCGDGIIATHRQFIKVADMVGPDLVCPADTIIGTDFDACSGSITLPYPEVSDDCSSDANISITVSWDFGNDFTEVSGIPVGSHTVTYTATDDCGNTSTCTMMVTVEDTTIPALSCESQRTISLNADSMEICASVFEDGAFDNCTMVVDSFCVRRMTDILFTPCVIFTCEDVGDTIQVELKVCDEAGNCNFCMVDVIVENPMAPMVTCPPNIILDCSQYPADTILAGSPQVNDICEALTVSYQDMENLNDCNTGTVNRTFTVTNSNGNTSVCTQTITYQQNISPIYTFPQDTVVECLADTDPSNTGYPVSTGSCNQLFFTGYQDDVIPFAENCRYLIQRRFTVLNNCDDTDTTHLQFINVEDVTAPVFATDTITVGYTCASDILPFTPTATDNCNSVVEVVMTDTETVDNNCGNQFTIVETYTATDSCGNVSEPFTYIIEVNDTVGPTADALPTLTFACVNDIPASDINVVQNESDNCGGTVTVSAVSTEIPSSCDDTVERVYRLTDECGNSTTLTQMFVINDDIAPTANALPDIGPFDCNNFPAFNTAAVTGAADNCGGAVVTVSFVGDTGVPSCSGIVIRTYRLTDECGNTADITQNILYENNTPPTATPPAPITVNCIAEIPDGSETDLTNISGGCGLTVTVTIDDSQFSDPGCVGSVMRRYILTDDCGNVNTVTQTINIDDQTAPTWNETAGSLDINTDCAEKVALTPPTATDGCSTVSISIQSDDTTNMNCVHQFERTVTYTAEDACGNVSAPFVIQIVVHDDIPPTANNLPDAGPFDCLSDYPPDVAGVTAVTDNCQGIVTVTWESDTDQPTCSGMVVRTYRLTDVCGNSSTITENILIEDTSFPSADPLPSLGTFTCYDLVPAPDAALVTNESDNCNENVSVSFFVDDPEIRCGDNTYTRTYHVTDECGNTTSITQEFTVFDNIPPVPNGDTIIGPFDCTESIPDSIKTVFSGVDNCGGTVLSELQTNDGVFNVTNCMDTVIQEFILTDVCGNDTTVSRYVLIYDTIPPVFTQMPGSLDDTVTCAIDLLNLTFPTAEDACRFILDYIVLRDTIEFDCANRYTERLGFLAIDQCLNVSTDTFFADITVIDTLPPMILSCPSDTIADDIDIFPEPIRCGEPFNFTISAVDDCKTVIFSSRIVEENGTIINLTGDIIDRDFNTGVNQVTYFVEDACGNIDSCSFTVTVRDITAPSYSCASSPYNIGVSLNNPQVIYPNSLVNSKDDCSPTEEPVFKTIVGTDTTELDSVYFDCSIFANNSSPVDTLIRIYLGDIYGNESEFPCGILVRVFNTGCPGVVTSTIAGGLHAENGTGTDLVEVYINGPITNDMVTTTTDGHYALSDLIMYEDYHIVPERLDNIRNGVSTFDLLLLKQHILGIQVLDTPYLLIAADINNDGQISSTDMIALRRAILLLDDEFPNNTSWRFIDNEWEFPEPNNPWATGFPESRYVHDLEYDAFQTDFMSVKIGDLNGSAVPAGLASGETRSNDHIVLTVDDQLLTSGQVYDVPFKATDFDNILGFQMTLDFDVNRLMVDDQSISSNTIDLNDRHINWSKQSDGQLLISWDSDRPMTLASETPLFTIRFRAKSDGQLRDALSIGKTPIASEAYHADMTIRPMTLEFDQSFDNEISSNEFNLLQNRPNPFQQQTTIPFILPEGGLTTLTITDITGRILLEKSAYFEAGYQEFVVEQTDLNVTGVLVYRVKSGRFEGARKMVTGMK